MIYLNDVPIKVERFPNGESHIAGLPGWTVVGDIVWLRLHWESDEDLIHLMFVKKYIESEFLVRSSVGLLIDYMPYSRMDRQTDDLFTLKYVAGFINSLGFDRVVVQEPHSDVTCALLDRSTPQYPSSTWLLQRAMDDIGFDKEKDYLLFPDAGAQKRYSNLGDYRTIMATKHRGIDGKLTQCRIDPGSADNETALFDDPKVIIVDDLCSYGGTFLSVVRRLESEWGVSNVYLVVTHLEESVFQGDLFKHEFIKGIYATNSICQEAFSVIHLYDIRTGRKIKQREWD